VELPDFLNPIINNMRLKFAYYLAAIASLLIAHSVQAANPTQVSQLVKTKECNGCDLSGADLIGADLAGAKLQGANLNAANLTGANLSGADLTRASLAGSNLVSANLQQAILTEASLVYANLALAQLNNAVLTNTDLGGANLTSANLIGAKVTKSSLVGANLYNLKATNSLSTTTNGNILQGGIKVGLTSAVTVVEKTLDGPLIEEGDIKRTFRKYRIPLWIGKPLRSSAGAVRFYHADNPNLEIDIW
jgi:Pentapeptide repeats (8 copies)